MLVCSMRCGMSDRILSVKHIEGLHEVLTLVTVPDQLRPGANVNVPNKRHVHGKPTHSRKSILKPLQTLKPIHIFDLGLSLQLQTLHRFRAQVLGFRA